MAAVPDLITVAQYRQMPDPHGGRSELHNGEVAVVAFASRKHHLMQRRFVKLLEERVSGFGEVGTEGAYRALPEFDLRAADVAVIGYARAAAIDPDDNLHGAPDLVVEIKSPSNRRGKLTATAALCLNNGALEFWVADMDQKSITVIYRNGSTAVYRSGQSVPLAPFGGGELPVDEVYADISMGV